MVRYFGGLLLAFTMVGGGALASGGGIHEDLAGALRCDGEPMDLLHELAAAGSSRSTEGFVGYEIGEEMDAISGVALTAPLMLGASGTHNVIATTQALHDGFGALVHARFEGDYRPLVARFNLTRSMPGESFKRAHASGDADEICPKTIELLPQEEGRFLFGCGWCNG